MQSRVSFSMSGGVGHLLHHADEATSRHRNDQQSCRDRAADTNSMRNASWQKDISPRPDHSLNTITDKGEFSVEDVKGFIFDMMKVVGSRMTWGRNLVNHRKSTAGRF